ncbi:hypothetical protein KBK24_0122995 [Burkholderia sp. K24]|jgi:hypothetical protein|uniref:Uncharacterized protein n=1 Tax=Paraburkholderia fungorum TaxID=134537 RepID=A0AAW3UY00_9BURK|nr:hypothetical protein KBK24_0122995 [Burkholderia sp. K24]MBB4519610.1 hypothetical protein [Paraburkholderia fungorum]MBB6203507.1 hypothetical protein [Paraburkholderia fungorum]
MYLSAPTFPVAEIVWNSKAILTYHARTLKRASLRQIQRQDPRYIGSDEVVFAGFESRGSTRISLFARSVEFPSGAAQPLLPTMMR